MKWPWRKEIPDWVSAAMAKPPTVADAFAAFPEILERMMHEAWQIPLLIGEPAMSVKVEKIEPPRQARFRIFRDSYNYSEFNEKDAREIYEGLAVHFAEVPCSSAQAGWFESMIREKDAEIARLKDQCSWYAGISSPYTEIRRLRGWLEGISAGCSDKGAGWAACGKKSDAARRALAGEKCPD